MKNPLRELWDRNEIGLNAWLNIGHSFSAEIMANQDFDALTVDCQHGPIDYSSLLPMFQAMRASGKALMARVPWRDPTWIMKFLDAGATGIICPMVNTAEQAEEFVSYLRYPPHGQRSWGPTRALFAHNDYSKDGANDAVLAFAMIETAEAMNNLEAIAKTPHLDALYIGPSDLSLGVSNGALPPKLDREEPEMIEAIKHILGVAHGNGLRAALHCGTPEYAARGVEWGFDLVTVGTDSAILAQGAAATAKKFRDLIA
ncbi:MAG: 2,4-dihydroxyhept-2-ene-1,7-dioic acid aldolase [Silicimonas sp.]|jgi:4-hydroxy-2-oxoheptanedioate aldolase|nr:2,4-dihydroxyhept-2-ene-1,7-dioic acid aldolase [Silicimonas sp.]